MPHTKESIQTLLATNDRAIARALVVLFERQTEDEQEAHETRHTNHRGFNHADAKEGTRMARVVLNGRPLSTQSMERARKMLMKYAGQLARIANERGER